MPLLSGISIIKSKQLGLSENGPTRKFAFDKAEMKQIIIETIAEYLPKTPLVIGLGMAGWGDSNSIQFRQADNLYICGDEKSEVSEENPPLAPRVGMVAHMQANTVLEILLKDKLNEDNSQ